MGRGSVNRVFLIGNLGRDPDIRYTRDGKMVANLSVATNEQWINASGDRKESTTWHRIVAWGKLAEFAQQYLTKGTKIYILGRLANRQWVNKNGETRNSVEIVAREIVILSPKGENVVSADVPEEISSPDESSAFLDSPPPDSEDDVPF